MKPSTSRSMIIDAGDRVVHELRVRVGLEAVREERRLETAREPLRVDARREAEVEDRRSGPVAERRERALRRRDPRPPRTARCRAGCRSRSPASCGRSPGRVRRAGSGANVLSSAKKPCSRRSVKRAEVPVAPVRHDVRVDDGEAGARCAPRPKPHGRRCSRVARLASCVRRVPQVRVVEAADRVVDELRAGAVPGAPRPARTTATRPHARRGRRCPRRVRSAPAMSAIGLSELVAARTSKPPLNDST